jgi:putative membrane protein
MKTQTLLLATCALVLGAAFAPSLAQSVGERSGINSTLGVAPKTEDFVTEVAISDMFEIESSKLASQKGNAAEKTFATQMITDHTKTSTELKGMVTGGKVNANLPTVLDSTHQAKLDKLNANSGDEFAKAYADDQIAAHKDAVNLFERYAKGGENAELKAWASKTLPALQHHLEMAQGLK